MNRNSSAPCLFLPCKKFLLLLLCWKCQADYEYMTKYFISDMLWAPVKSNLPPPLFLNGFFSSIFTLKLHFIPKVGRVFHIERILLRLRSAY